MTAGKGVSMDKGRGRGMEVVIDEGKGRRKRISIDEGGLVEGRGVCHKGRENTKGRKVATDEGKDRGKISQHGRMGKTEEKEVATDKGEKKARGKRSCYRRKERTSGREAFLKLQ